MSEDKAPYTYEELAKAMDICASCQKEGSQEDGGAIAWTKDDSESPEYWFCRSCWSTYMKIWIIVDSCESLRELAPFDHWVE